MDGTRTHERIRDRSLNPSLAWTFCQCLLYGDFLILNISHFFTAKAILCSTVTLASTAVITITVISHSVLKSPRNIPA